MLKFLFILIVLSSAGCNNAKANQKPWVPANIHSLDQVDLGTSKPLVSAFHDDFRGVTCWCAYGSSSAQVSISCLRDVVPVK